MFVMKLFVRKLPNLVIALTAVLFLWAGLAKAVHPAEAYVGLVTIGINRFLAEGLILVVATTELALGVMLLKPHVSKPVRACTSGLLGVFCLYLYYLRTLADPPGCSCPGLHGIFDSARAQALLGLARNVVLLGMLAWAWGELDKRADLTKRAI